MRLDLEHIAILFDGLKTLLGNVEQQGALAGCREL